MTSYGLTFEMLPKLTPSGPVESVVLPVALDVQRAALLEVPIIRPRQIRILRNKSVFIPYLEYQNVRISPLLQNDSSTIHLQRLLTQTQNRREKILQKHGKAREGSCWDPVATTASEKFQTKRSSLSYAMTSPHDEDHRVFQKETEHSC